MPIEETILGFVIGGCITIVLAWLTVPIFKKRMKVADEVEPYIERFEKNINQKVAKVENRISEIANGIMIYADNQIVGFQDKINTVLTNDIPHAVQAATDSMLESKKLDELFQAGHGMIKAAVTEGITELADKYGPKIMQMWGQNMGKASGDARAEKKNQKEARRASALALIETKFPGAKAFIPQIEKMLGLDLVGMAADNPEAAMMVLDKFINAGGGQGGGGGVQPGAGYIKV